MNKGKLMAAIVATCMAAGLVLIFSSDNIDARSRTYPPAPHEHAMPKIKKVELVRLLDQTDEQIVEKLKAGWHLGGIYRDCGIGFGEIDVTIDIDRLLLPAYVEQLEATKAEMLTLLKKTNTSGAAQKALDNIVAGDEKLTKYGTLPEYTDLQMQYEKLVATIAEIQNSPAEGIVSVDELLTRLDDFLESGDKADVNSAKRTIQTLGRVLGSDNMAMLEGRKSTADKIAVLDKTRELVGKSLLKADKLGGGCQMVYTFYLPEYGPVK